MQGSLHRVCRILGVAEIIQVKRLVDKQVPRHVANIRPLSSGCPVLPLLHSDLFDSISNHWAHFAVGKAEFPKRLEVTSLTATQTFCSFLLIPAFG